LCRFSKSESLNYRKGGQVLYILGIHASGSISSAALIKDGEIIAAVPEERIVRRKSTSEFPVNSINFCLDYASIKLKDVDYIAVAWNPGINASHRYRGGFSDWVRTPMERLYSVPNRLLTLQETNKVVNTEEIFSFIDNTKISIHHITHHCAHAANAFYLSSFEEAAIYTSDYFGENTTASWGVGNGEDIELFQEMHFPHSIGALYAAFTEFLGFVPESEEWKVMGASSYGNPEKFINRMRKLYELREDGKIELNLNYFNHFNFETGGFFSNKIYELFGEQRLVNEPLSTVHFDIAAALQQVIEEILIHALDILYEKTKLKHLCLGGGTFMNCVFNGKVLSKTRFERFYVPFAPDDSGNSIGAALYLYHKILKNKIEINRSVLPYVGPEWNNGEIEEILSKYNLKFVYVEDIEHEIAQALSNGKIVGWSQGRMEFGQRALGNRSILADPRENNMKERINAAIKYREGFRPFAPAILEEHVESYFVLNQNSGNVPFMEIVLSFKKERIADVPAVVHVDGTGRLQTVNRTSNPRFYRLIDEFRKITGIPIVLNTSFNTSREPIVLSPEDAIKTFYTSGLDCLVIGNYVINK
jgi:carbamoyltransferase